MAAAHCRLVSDVLEWPDMPVISQTTVLVKHESERKNIYLLAFFTTSLFCPVNFFHRIKECIDVLGFVLDAGCIDYLDITETSVDVVCSFDIRRWSTCGFLL